jgi:Leucine-rich repeat (LRR) protein
MGTFLSFAGEGNPDHDRNTVTPSGKSKVSSTLPASERAALIAIYNSTNGDNWTDNSGWKTPPLHGDGFAMPGTEDNWHGIDVQSGHVRNINLYMNNTTGSLPPEVGDLTQLYYIGIEYSDISGPIPKELGSISTLGYIIFTSNKLSGPIPPELGQLSNLDQLQLTGNKLTGQIPIQLTNLSKLSLFHVYDNDMSGPIPPELSNMKSLLSLYLSVNSFSGPIPPELGDLPDLEMLYLDNNQLTGTIPVELADLTNIREIYLSVNQLTGTVPPEFGQLKELTNFDVTGNQLTGTIPPEFGNCSNLEHLAFGRNNMTGGIPLSLTQLSKLRTLTLEDNKFSGAIPPQLGNLSNLETLILCGNRFTGTIPDEICQCTELWQLGLSDNHLQGTVPGAIGNLNKLRHLHLEQNKLLGPLPSSLKNLTLLTGASSDFDYNGFYTDDAELKAFLDGMDSYWFGTQTVAPDDMSAEGISTSAIRLSWENVGRQGSGIYDVYYSLTAGGPYTFYGSVPDRLRNSFDITGLDAGTTYYFVMKSHSYVHPYNKNEVISDYSEEVSAVTFLPEGTYLLDVQSSPYTGIGITVSPDDYSGNGSGSTGFSRIYTGGTTVTLTAPAVFNGNNFIKWQIDGVDNSGTAVQVTMDANHTVTAIYDQATPPDTHTLTVKSSPDAGAGITVSPTDNDGNGNGTTTFTRTYDQGTTVTLTAPTELNGNAFSKWLVDGVEKSGSSIQVTMNADHTATALYEQQQGETRTLTIESTHGHGCPVTVSPTDENGDSDGTTKFKRYYRDGTEVTLTVPAEYNGKKFDHWKLDGTKVGSGVTVTITISGDHKIKAFYVTPSHPGLVVRPNRINFGYIINEELPPAQIMRVTLNGSPVDWTAEADVSWLTLASTSGYGSAEVQVALNNEAASLAEGKYGGTITVTAPDADHSPQSVNVTLTVYQNDATIAPIGDFSTPIDSSTVYSSVPVTGWVVDDIGVENVKIYRKENNKLVFVGEAVFVEGARPDIEVLYPDYPLNYQAGWGYMLLTHFLPDGGNGTFTLHAVAVDVEGNETTLGTRTIICDNANAVKPFGAIDTPLQGGVASGGDFVNWGWVLTPQPNMIPTDGSTIDVYVDGVKLGHPRYNIYREDIATFFPGYANNDGAVGYYTLDTTAYEDGVHTIQWVAVDDAGNADGIGSRYFSVQNSQSVPGGAPKWSTAHSNAGRGNPAWSPGTRRVAYKLDDTAPVLVKRGYNPNAESTAYHPDDNGIITVEIKELERIEIRLFLGRAVGLAPLYSAPVYPAPLYTPLPIGSTLDAERGIFYWQPGPGFVDRYRFVFFAEDADGNLIQKHIEVLITP